MIKNQFRQIYAYPTWLLYECDRGNHWTAVKGGPYEHPQDKPCNYSGCTGNNHGVKRIGETTNRIEAYNWVHDGEVGRDGQNRNI